MREDDDDTRDDAVARQVACDRCNLSGQVVLWHPSHDGSLLVRVINDRGIPIQIPGRIVAHCVCEVGKWMRRRTEVADCMRIPNLEDVISGRMKWLTYDPTTPRIDPAKLPRGDWRAVFRIVAAAMGADTSKSITSKPPEPKAPRLNGDPILQQHAAATAREPGCDDD